MDNQDFSQHFFDISHPKFNWAETELERDLDFMNLTSKHLNLSSIPFVPLESPESPLSLPYMPQKAEKINVLEQSSKKSK